MKIGDPAPDFELQANTGENVKLSNYFGEKIRVWGRLSPLHQNF